MPSRDLPPPVPSAIDTLPAGELHQHTAHNPPLPVFSISLTDFITPNRTYLTPGTTAPHPRNHLPHRVSALSCLVMSDTAPPPRQRRGMADCPVKSRDRPFSSLRYPPGPGRSPWLTVHLQTQVQDVDVCLRPKGTAGSVPGI